MRKMKCSELVLDFDLYPRANVDSKHVTDIAQALAIGVEMPPVVIDKKSKRVVDGFHRIRAAVRVFGDAAEFEVVEKSYKSDGDLFMDAMRYNSAHGAKLDTFDKAHCVLRAVDLGIDDAAIADALHVKEEWIGELRVGRSAKDGKLHVPLKNTIKHMRGKHLTKPQAAANQKLGGMNQAFYVNQLITLIESDLLDRSNEELMKRLAVLGKLLDGVLVGV